MRTTILRIGYFIAHQGPDVARGPEVEYALSHIHYPQSCTTLGMAWRRVPIYLANSLNSTALSLSLSGCPSFIDSTSQASFCQTCAETGRRAKPERLPKAASPPWPRPGHGQTRASKNQNRPDSRQTDQTRQDGQVRARLAVWFCVCVCRWLRAFVPDAPVLFCTPTLLPVNVRESETGKHTGQSENRTDRQDSVCVWGVNGHRRLSIDCQTGKQHGKRQRDGERGEMEEGGKNLEVGCGGRYAHSGCRCFSFLPSRSRRNGSPRSVILRTRSFRIRKPPHPPVFFLSGCSVSGRTSE